MAKHQHEWTKSTDWDFGPSRVVFECFGCRGMRVIATQEKARMVTVPDLGDVEMRAGHEPRTTPRNVA